MDPLIQDLLDLLRIFKGKLPTDVYQDLYDLTNEGEREVALGSLCEVLSEQEIPVHDTTLEKIKVLTAQLKLPPTTWSFLLMK